MMRLCGSLSASDQASLQHETAVNVTSPRARTDRVSAVLFNVFYLSQTFGGPWPASMRHGDAQQVPTTLHECIMFVSFFNSSSPKFRYTAGMRLLFFLCRRTPAQHLKHEMRHQRWSKLPSVSDPRCGQPSTSIHHCILEKLAIAYHGLEESVACF
jgi:hypothetical protein